MLSDQGGVQPQNDNRTVSVEWALIVHPAVAEAVAQSGVPEEGAPLRVYVVLQEGAAADDAQRAALTAHVEEAMAGDAPPLEFIFVDSLPKTRTGKVARWMLGQEGNG